jgi:hypothetical protein
MASNAPPPPPPTYALASAYGSRIPVETAAAAAAAENDIDSSDEEGGPSTIAHTIRRLGRHAAHAARRTKRFVKRSLQSATLSDANLRRLFDREGYSIPQITAIGYPLVDLKRVIGLDCVEQLCASGLSIDVIRQADPCFRAETWSLLIAQFGMSRRDLKNRFNLVDFSAYLEAGLNITHLVALDLDAHTLLALGKLSRPDLARARAAGWSLTTWRAFNLDYDALLALGMQRGDYVNLMRIDPSRMAQSLGILEPTPDNISACKHIGLFF